MSRRPKKRAANSPSFQSSEELYQALFEEAADGIFINNTQGQYVEVNQRGCEMLGYTREEILELSIADLIPAEDLTHDPLQLDALRGGKTLLKERRLRCKNGRLLPVEINARMLSDGSFLGIVRDISKRKQTEQNLALMNFALNNVHEAAFLIDKNGHFQYVNEESCRVLGYSREELLNLRVADLDPDFPTERWPSHWLNLQKHHSLIFESRHKTKDGRLIPVEINANYFEYDGQGYDLALVRDVTERKQAERALRESEERLHLLMEHSPFGIQVFNMDGTLLQVNQTWEKLWGVRAEEVVGTYNALDDPQLEFLGLRSFVNQAFAGKEVSFQDIHYDPAKFGMPGRERWVRAYGYQISIQEERFQQVVLLTEDITVAKEREEALRQSEAKWRTLAETVPDVIMTVDREGTLLFINRSVTGADQDEFIGQNFYDFVMDEYRDTAEKHIESVFQTGKPTRYEAQGPKGLNPPRWFITRIGAVQRGEEVIAVTIIATDITELKQADEALRASEERFRALYHENPSMFFTLDADGIITSVNGFGASQLGYTKGELEGQPVLKVFYEEDKAAVSEHLITCLQNPGKVYSWQFRKVHKTGNVMWVEEFVRAIKGPDGVINVLVVCQDITERKQLEAANEQLTAQFYQAQKMESIGQLAGGIAHDFNNLLVPIIGYIDLNLTNLSPDSRLYADLTQVSKAANRAADLTRQILAFSRQQVLTLRLLDLNTIIEEFKKMLQRLIGEDIELQTFLTPQLFPIKADRGQIEQVLMNLAINARDAMPAGGKLTIETGNFYLDEAYLEKYANDLIPGHYTMLAVSDTGHGMDAETLKRIFDPFFTTKESGKGTGLGLATVFGIIKQHQGHIWVYSEFDQGTTFKIYLPKAKEITQTAVPISQQPTSIYGTETVMVVEDDEMVRKLVCETLEAHGYNVLEALSPTDCLDIAAKNDPIHLLLTDVIMPEMNGKELYQQLISIHPQSRVLYMSGYTNSVVFHHSILEEGINFLQKPFTVQNLTRKVKEVLG